MQPKAKEDCELIARLDRGMELIGAAQARGDTGEEARLLAHWKRLDEAYRQLYGRLQEGEE